MYVYYCVGRFDGDSTYIWIDDDYPMWAVDDLFYPTECHWLVPNTLTD